MLLPDFSNQPYIAEVLSTKAAKDDVLETIEGLLTDDFVTEQTATPWGDVSVSHGFIASYLSYHRSTRTIVNKDKTVVTFPRIKVIRKREHFLYDVFVVNRDKHFIVAVPFHGLARYLFPKIDTALAGKRVLYETLNITRMIIGLGAEGKKSLVATDSEDTSIVVTRCHLAYDDPRERRRDLEQVRLTGANLGKTDIYGRLVNPVLYPKTSPLEVTPALLGFALFSNGVKKSGATSDHYGNLRISVGPGLRQLTRLFGLLDAIEEMKEVTSTTSNIPILQSTQIETAE